MKAACFRRSRALLGGVRPQDAGHKAPGRDLRTSQQIGRITALSSRVRCFPPPSALRQRPRAPLEDEHQEQHDQDDRDKSAAAPCRRMAGFIVLPRGVPPERSKAIHDCLLHAHSRVKPPYRPFAPCVVSLPACAITGALQPSGRHVRTQERPYMVGCGAYLRLTAAIRVQALRPWRLPADSPGDPRRVKRVVPGQDEQRRRALP